MKISDANQLKHGYSMAKISKKESAQVEQKDVQPVPAVSGTESPPAAKPNEEMKAEKLIRFMDRFGAVRTGVYEKLMTRNGKAAAHVLDATEATLARKDMKYFALTGFSHQVPEESEMPVEQEISVVPETEEPVIVPDTP